MSLFEQTMLYLDIVGVAAFSLSLIYFVRRPYRLNTPYLFFGFWVALFLFEYYFLGPNSYIHMNDEGDHFVPYYLYLINHHLGGQFGHAVGGGHDVIASFSPGLQLVSPEIFALKVFPIWIAVLLHKFVVVTVGLIGSYLMCRTASNCSQATAAFAAALFTVSNENLVYMTYTMGSGLAFLPLLIYVLVLRSEKPKYFRHVLWVSLISVLYLDVTHIFIPTMVALFIAALVYGRFNWRSISALVVLGVFELLNWGEVIYAMHVYSPYTDRGGVFAIVNYDFKYLSHVFSTGLQRLGEVRIIWLALGVIAASFILKSSLRYRGAAAVIGLAVAYYFFVLFPWEIIGLAEVSNLSHQYIFLALAALILPIITETADAAGEKFEKYSFKHSLAPQATVLALAIGMVVYFKGYNIANFLHHGGQSQYTTIDNLLDPSWRPQDPYRVITLRVRDLGPEAALAYANYGLEAYDVYMMLTPKQRRAFFQNGVRKTDNKKYGHVDLRTFIDWSKWKNGHLIEFDKQVSFPLLRLANVGFILTPVPMKARGLKLVAAPESLPLIKNTLKSDTWSYLKQRIERIFDFNDLYVYQLSDTYPQVFPARQIITVEDNVTESDLLEKIEKSVNNFSRPAVLRSSEADKLGASSSNLNVRSFHQVKNGYDVEINSPDGGVLILNTTALPFWQARGDGKPLQIVEANLIQIAVSVPPGVKNVTFRYHRPTLFDAATRFKQSMFSTGNT